MSFDVLFFEVHGRRCALPVSVVREVIATPPVTPVPLTPPLLRGLVPVHGQVLPLLDVGAHLGPGSGETAEAPRFLLGEQERIVVVEAASPTPAEAGSTTRSRPTTRLAFAATRINRLGSINEGHSRQPPHQPRFATATVFDVEGPALLLDVALAMEALRQSLQRAGLP